MVTHDTSFYAIPFGILIFLFAIYFIRLARYLYVNHYIQYLCVNISSIQKQVNERAIFRYHLLLAISLLVTGYIIANILGVILAVAVSLYIPVIIVNRLKQKYICDFVDQLPDAMNAMSAMLRAGTHINKSFHLIAEQQTSPISSEFVVVLAESKMGKDFNEALNAMAGRLNRQEIGLFVAAVNIASTVGGNLAETLDILSGTLRERHALEGKIMALTAMGRLQGKLISLLPFCVLGILLYQDPELIDLLYRHPHTWFAILIMCLIIVLATVMINRITNIKV